MIRKRKCLKKKRGCTGGGRGRGCAGGKIGIAGKERQKELVGKKI